MVARADVIDLDDRDNLCELLADLIEHLLSADNHKGHPREVGVFGFESQAALFGSLFARSFLHTAQHSRWIDRILLALAACGALVMALALLTSYAMALRLATGLALVFTVTIFIAARP